MTVMDAPIPLGGLEALIVLAVLALIAGLVILIVKAGTRKHT